MIPRIAVDAMGGDHAPDVVVEGAILSAKEAKTAHEIFLFGQEESLNTLLSKHGGENIDSIHVVHAPDVIEMDESPSTALKSKPNSSIHLGLGYVKAGKCDAFLSNGNTGAAMAGALFILGRLPNVSRPSLAGIYPTTKSFSIVMDVGANVDCKPSHLAQFAKMGSIYAEKHLKRDNPIVALMNVGEEPGKGNEQVKAAFEEIEKLEGINFIGNIEGRDLMHHAADVVVCDGFVGNIMLKLGESVATALKQMFMEAIQGNNLSQEEAGLVKKVLGSVFQRFNYEEYGGAPLLGVNGTVLIGHGGSSARACKHIIQEAAEIAPLALPAAIESAL